MKKLIPSVFILVAAALIFAFFCRNLFVKDTSFSRAKVVIPLVDNAQDEKDKFKDGYDDDTAQKSFIQLANDETLIGTVEFDINGDGFDDQINIVKTSSNPYIVLVVGLYDSEKGSYSRDCFIGTTITQVRTFACTGLDVVGNHKNSLVYQGVDDKGKVVLRIFNSSVEKNTGKFKLVQVGNFEADGTIYIQQNQRPESYELSRAKGESFPVWVYTSDVSNAQDSSLLDQIQTMYEWDEAENLYVPTKTIRVAGNRVAAKELAKIQDGTVASFGKFLDGLWCKTDNSGNNMRFIFFDYSNSEIIFEFEDCEEVYSWLNSNLRRNGIYFSAVNKSIENLQRRFDISLVNIDEIRIKLQDDVRMLISESNLWDGNYKKFVSREAPKTKKTIEEECLETLVNQRNWIMNNDDTVIAFSDSAFSTKSKKELTNGRFVVTEINGTKLLQFRTTSEKSVLNGCYIPSFGGPRKNDKEAISLQSVSVSPEGFYKEQTPPTVIRKYTPPKEDEVEKLPEIQSYTQSDQGKNASAPKLSVSISPQYFSPDGDGEYDELNILLNADCNAPIKSWSFVVNDAESKKTFWSFSGTSELKEKLSWDGKSLKGELVQSATDYPYVFTVTDVNGLTNTVKGFVQVDVLVIHDGDKLKLQVPSIIFRSDAADFKTTAEVTASPGWDGVSKGISQETLENNTKVLNRISEILKKFRGYDITIEGNANNLSGTEKEEASVKKLSEDRAKFVMDWLIKDGVPSTNLKAVGNGSKNPVTRSTKLEDRWKNRRVEFILKK